MSIQRLKKILKQPEGIRLEFKTATTSLPGNLFETVCAMLNREGGDIVLGVADDGTLKGIDPSSVPQMMKDLVNLSNNPNKLDPPFILFPQTYPIEGKHLIHLQVPESSQIHKTNNVVYDRSNDGDFKLIQAYLIAEIYNRKRTHYSEGIIYSKLQFSDFNQDLFPKVRNLIKSSQSDHPWLSLSDEQMLKKAGLWKRDFQSGEEGYTLAAVLLFGKDEVIQQVLPHYKTDALVRVENVLRYDDREYIQTNLIDAYEKLMAFTAKHLPDKFYLENDQRVSLRSKIFREVVANLLVHREYLNAHPCTFIIYSDRVETENANNPHGYGPINPEDFAPFPKNPAIAKFFIQLGRVDELGSGVLNVNRLLKEYSGGKPQFIEATTFKMVLPVNVDELLQENVQTQDDIFEGTVEGANGGNGGEVGGDIKGPVEGAVEGTNFNIDKEAKSLSVNSIGGDGGEIEGTNDGKPFIEGPIEGAIGGDMGGIGGDIGGDIERLINEKTSGFKSQVKSKLAILVKTILEEEGKRIPDYIKITGFTLRSMERYIKILREVNFIEFRGDPYNDGGYYPTDHLKNQLKEDDN